MKTMATNLLLMLGVSALSVLAVQAGAAPKAVAQDPPRQAAPAKASPTTVRLAQVRRYAARIKPGTPRSLVIRLFPKQQGGLMSSDLTSYYAGDGVVVDVPYDERGGAWKGENRVSGPLKVYRGSFHID